MGRSYPMSWAESAPAVSEKHEADRSALENLIVQAVEPTGVWVEEVRVVEVSSQTSLQIVLDVNGASTEGLTLDEVGEATRLISDTLDAQGDVIPGLGSQAYTLEVSTPGVERPLVRPHHWERNVGRIVEVQVQPVADNGGEGATPRTIRARILSVDDGGAELEEIIPPAKKGMRPKEADPQRFGFQELSHAVIQVQLSS